MKCERGLRSGWRTTIVIDHMRHLAIEHHLIYWKQFTEGTNSFSIDKQRDQVNAEWMSRPVDARKPLALVLISMEQSLIFADRLKRKLLSGPIFGGAYNNAWLKTYAFKCYISVPRC